jgi:mRNA interferase RelE/StbE
MKTQCNSWKAAANFRIEWKPSALREFKKLPSELRPVVREHVERLEAEPRPEGCRKLAGFAQAYRIRIGNYRLIYEIDDKIVRIYILRIRHRSEAYRQRD